MSLWCGLAASTAPDMNNPRPIMAPTGRCSGIPMHRDLGAPMYRGAPEMRHGRIKCSADAVPSRRRARQYE